jgi:aquaporin Z
MNPIRSLTPDVVANNYAHYWVYLAGPLLGGLVAVLCAFVLRGRGGGRSGSEAAQGSLDTRIGIPGKS